MKSISAFILMAFTAQSVFAVQPVTPAEQTVWVAQDDAQTMKELHQERMSRIQAMSDVEISERLLAASIEIQSKLDTLSGEQKEVAANMAATLQKLAQKKNIKKKLLNGLKRAGQTALFGLGMAGSTVLQAVFVPASALMGFFSGLVRGECNESNEIWRQYFLYSENSGSFTALGIVAVVAVEIVLIGPELFMFGLASAVFGGLMPSYIACSSDRYTSDPYAAKLCNIFKKYNGSSISTGAIVRVTTEGSSVAGAGVHNGVKYVAGKVKKLFKKKKKVQEEDSESSEGELGLSPQLP